MTRRQINALFGRLVVIVQKRHPVGIQLLTWGDTSIHPPGSFLNERAMGQCTWDGRTATIQLAPKATQHAPQVVEGVLMHELGHAILFSRKGPGHDGDDVDTVEARYIAERAADLEAEEVFKRAIYYDPELWIQRTDGGIYPRPMELDRMLAPGWSRCTAGARGWCWP